MADQGPVLPLPGRGLVGLGDHVQDQEFGQDLGVQVVGLLGALGNHLSGLAWTSFLLGLGDTRRRTRLRVRSPPRPKGRGGTATRPVDRLIPRKRLGSRVSRFRFLTMMVMVIFLLSRPTTLISSLGLWVWGKGGKTNNL